MDGDAEVVKKKKIKLKKLKKNADPSLEAAMAKVAINGGELARCTEIMRAERDVVLVAVAQDGLALAFAAATLMRDYEVVLTAVKSDGPALRWGH